MFRYREQLVVIRDYVIGWWVALSLWMVVRNFGVTPDNAPIEPSISHYVRLTLVFGAVAGVLFGIAQLKMEKHLYRRVPLWRLGAYSLITDLIIMMIIFSMAYKFFRDVVGFKEEITFLKFISDPSAILTFFYFGFVSFVLAFIRQLNLLLGKGNLLRFIKGDFYRPRVEKRVFMFIDLRDSTGIAERLGHLNYSRFIQDCFYDLHVVQNYGAEVYQYVGDEVVLSWRIKRRMDFSKCLKAFWAFEDRLAKRTSFYQKEYGIVPKFKAGLHLGEVTTAEVGEIKKEIAYHGDTINITSRIQDRCNHFDKTLLVSELFHSQLNENGDFNLQLMGQEQLRGKRERIGVYAVNRN